MTLEEVINHCRNREYMSGVERDKTRVKATGEVFTPTELVQEMLDRLPHDLFSNPTKTVIDNSCGDGQFLSEVLIRKLGCSINFETALSTIYGVDIMADNIREARIRLIKVIRDHVKSNHLPAPDRIKLIKILWKNLICTPLRKYKNGSLDYDFNFNHTVSDHTANKIFKMISKQKLLDQVVI